VVAVSLKKKKQKRTKKKQQQKTKNKQQQQQQQDILWFSSSSYFKENVEADHKLGQNSFCSFLFPSLFWFVFFFF